MKKACIGVIMTLLVLSFSGIAPAGTCEPVGTGTPGYWMTHPEAWPVSEITIGSTSYSQSQAIELMKNPVKGDKWLTMFSAYVAAFLNVQIGNCPPTCYTLYEVNNWLINFLGSRPVPGNSEAWQYSHGEALYWCLDGYNNGLMPGIPSRDSLE